ncbi:hypothetical protein FA95DRAFT_1471647, partial [Auriscalpium vulgare]
RAICMLCNAVLLRPVAHSVTAPDAMSSGEGDELVGHVLPALVILQVLDLRIQVVLSIHLEVLERGKDL